MSKIAFLATIGLNYKIFRNNQKCYKCKDHLINKWFQVIMVIIFHQNQDLEVSFNIDLFCSKCADKNFYSYSRCYDLKHFQTCTENIMRYALRDFYYELKAVFCKSCYKITHNDLCDDERCKVASKFNLCKNCNLLKRHSNHESCDMCHTLFDKLETMDISYRSIFYQLLEYLLKQNVNINILFTPYVCKTCKKILTHNYDAILCKQCYCVMFCSKECKKSHKTCNDWKNIWTLSNCQILVEKFYNSYYFDKKRKILKQKFCNLK